MNAMHEEGMRRPDQMTSDTTVGRLVVGGETHRVKLWNLDPWLQAQLREATWDDGQPVAAPRREDDAVGRGDQ